MSAVRIERIYPGPADCWQEISVDEFLRCTQWAGVFPKGTVLVALEKAGEVKTMFAVFRIAEVMKG
jgi:hypothetical protein